MTLTSSLPQVRRRAEEEALQRAQAEANAQAEARSAARHARKSGDRWRWRPKDQRSEDFGGFLCIYMVNISPDLYIWLI